MEISKITKKGQITIPKAYRELLNLHTGESVIFTLENGNLILKKAEADPLSQLVGIGKNILEPNLKLQKKLRNEWDE
ncbi:MAG: AbrB/MazE/SpoVT family DNA-binding domain-containing protein [Candidatus Kariarchaeaceae archaeon]|jgi:AbrB family looped-hinge helix DNA binding protein